MSQETNDARSVNGAKQYLAGLKRYMQIVNEIKSDVQSNDWNALENDQISKGPIFQ